MEEKVGMSLWAVCYRSSNAKDDSWRKDKTLKNNTSKKTGHGPMGDLPFSHTVDMRTRRHHITRGCENDLKN